MYVGLLKFDLWLDGNRELKYKRNLIRKIRDRVKSKFNVSISRVDEEPDDTDRATIGLSITGNSAQVINTKLTKAMNFIESMSLGRIDNEKQNVIFFDD